MIARQRHSQSHQSQDELRTPVQHPATRHWCPDLRTPDQPGAGATARAAGRAGGCRQGLQVANARRTVRLAGCACRLLCAASCPSTSTLHMQAGYCGGIQRAQHSRRRADQRVTLGAASWRSGWTRRRSGRKLPRRRRRSASRPCAPPSRRSPPPRRRCAVAHITQLVYQRSAGTRQRLRQPWVRQQVQGLRGHGSFVQKTLHSARGACSKFFGT